MTTPASPAHPVAEGIFGLLNVASLKAPPPTGAGCLGGVRDYVPQPAVFPFLFYELFLRDVSGLGAGASTKQVQLRLHVFSKFPGGVEERRIMAEAIRLLQFQEFTVNGWRVPAIGRPNDEVSIDSSEINGEICRELVTIWDSVFVDEVA